jgi:hypothetical protein
MQMRLGVTFFRLSIVLTLIFLLAFMPSLIGSPDSASADTVDDPLVYGQWMKRYYKSSIDGATLPCYVYVPNTANRLSLWVDLHAFGGHGDGPYLADMYYQDLGLPWPPYKTWADNHGIAILSPYGRNYKSMYADTKELGNPEPRLFDDFAVSTDSWEAVDGRWSLDIDQGCYAQTSNLADGDWKDAAREHSTGINYTASVRMKQSASSQIISAMGITFRRHDSDNYYLADLCKWGNSRQVRLFKKVQGGWEPLSIEAYDWQDDVWYELKVSVFEDCIEVHVDNQLQNLDASMRYHIDPTEGNYRVDSSFESGGVGLASFQGLHYFDDFRVQNEFLYGERDVLDCTYQFMEEMSVDPNSRIDPSRIFLSGYSMGGVGTWNVGLHFPDLFLALHPSFGTTDLKQAFEWMNTQFPDPDQADPQLFPGIDPDDFWRDQDGQIGEAVKAFMGGDPDEGNTEMMSSLHENSARFILENALNIPIRIEHPEYDALITNTLSPMTIWWEKKKLNDKGEVEGTEMEAMRQSTSDYAQCQYIWQRWLDYPDLTNCNQETSGYGEWGETPAQLGLGGDIWDDWDYTEYGAFDNLASPGAKYGAHGNESARDPAYQDQWLGIPELVHFFSRSQDNYLGLHVDPGEVAYKTYDDVHDKAWWLTVDIAYPNQDRPGLARVSKDTPSNGAQIHVKNVRTTTLDVLRMGLNTSSGQTMTITLDNNTSPEAEPLADTWNKTDLKLVGEWYPAGSYTVALNGVPKDYSLTGTVMTIEDIPTNTASTLTITMPQGMTNMVANPGFELHQGPGWFWFWYIPFTLHNWTGDIHYFGGGEGIFEHNAEFAWDRDDPIYAHTGTGAVRIKDARAYGWPFISSWDSDPVTVNPGQTYTASAFAKTRVLYSKNRAVVNGKYDDVYCCNAGVGILWLNGSRQPMALSSSTGIHGSNDWTPLEVSAAAPTGAAFAKVIVFTINPDGDGSCGSAWFDDVALR